MRCRKILRSYNAAVFKRAIQVFVLISLVVAMSGHLEAANARIKKVLPQLIDLQGRNSVSPSLYERDAYQEFLRKNPEKRGGLCFQVQWTGNRTRNLILRVEMRGVRENVVQTKTLEMPLRKKGWFSTWTPFVVRDATYHDLGDLTAWRVTLWDGGKQISEQKSFLW
jgi:hypothetical protein